MLHEMVFACDVLVMGNMHCIHLAGVFLHRCMHATEVKSKLSTGDAVSLSQAMSDWIRGETDHLR